MKVGELIDELLTLDPELPVMVCDTRNGCTDSCGGASENEVHGDEEAGEIIDMKPGERYAVIFVPGY